MSSRDLSDILLDLINDKTIDAVVERLRARALGENSVAESTVDSLASMWRKNLSAMKSHGAEEGSAGARADASAAAAWRLAETVEPLPADRAQGCRSAPHRTAKRPRGHSGSVRGSFYGFLKV